VLVGPNGVGLREFGVTAVRHPSTGIYCITLVATVPVSTAAPVATQDVALSPSTLTTPVFVTINSAAKACTGNSVEVQTFAGTQAGPARAPADEAFTLVVS
jgi:hypothetical protein